MRLSDANDFAGYLQEMAGEMREAGLESTAEDYIKAASTITDLTGLVTELSSISSARIGAVVITRRSSLYPLGGK